MRTRPDRLGEQGIEAGLPQDVPSVPTEPTDQGSDSPARATLDSLQENVGYFTSVIEIRNQPGPVPVMGSRRVDLMATKGSKTVGGIVGTTVQNCGYPRAPMGNAHVG